MTQEDKPKKGALAGTLSILIRESKNRLIKLAEKKLMQLALKKLLNTAAMGGIKGWLIKFVVTRFVKEVTEVIKVTSDYVELRVVTTGTINNEDRNEATDILNDIIK